MLIADFQTPCSTCNGTGFVAGFQSCGSLIPNLRKVCPDCNGECHQLTELGAQLWALYQPKIQEAAQEIMQQQPVRKLPCHTERRLSPK
mgnify:FL=1|jgi:RecJ-like exonuclease